MTQPVPVPPQRAQWVVPGYGLGLMIESRSSHGALWGHNGNGPGFTASALHAPTLRGRSVTVCALVAAEDEQFPEDVVRRTLDRVACRV